MKRDWKKWFAAAGIRAVRTIAQELIATIPVGFIITPTMIATLDITIVHAVIAWLATGVLAGVLSMLTSLTGLPELEEEIKENENGI